MNAKTRARWRGAVGATVWTLFLTGTVGNPRAAAPELADPARFQSSSPVTDPASPVDGTQGGWESVGPDGGRIEALVQCPSNPQRMYALPYRLGLYRSDDRGESWSRVESELPPDTYYQALAVSPVDDDVLLLAERAGRDVLRSEDGGRTWSRHAVGIDWVGVSDLCFDPHDPGHVLLAASGVAWNECRLGYPPVGTATGGLYQSRDGGSTWSGAGLCSMPDSVPGPVAPRDAGRTGHFSPELPRPMPLDIAFDPGTPGTILVGSDKGLYRSTDDGRKWSLVATTDHWSPTGWQQPETIAAVSFSRSDPSRVWAIRRQVETPARWELLRSDDGGLTFLHTVGTQNARFLDVAIADHPLDATQVLVGIAYYGSGIKVYRAAQSNILSPPVYDGPLSGEQRISALAFDPQVPDRVYLAIANHPYTKDRRRSVMTRHGLVRSDDGGQSWSPGMSGIRGLRIAGLGDDATGSIWVRSGTDRGLYRTVALGDAWTEIQVPMRAPSVFHVDERGSGILSEGGYSSPDCLEGGCGAGHTVSTDGGSTWSDPWFPGIPPEGCCDCPVPELIVSGGGPDCYVWVGGTECGVVRMAADGSYEPHETDFWAAGAAMDPAEPLRMFAVEAWRRYSQSSGTVLLTTDGGATWAPTPGQPHPSSPDPDEADRGVDLFMDPENSDRLVVVYKTTGVWETTDAGSQWRRIPTGTGGASVVAADWDPRTDRVFLMTRGGRIWGTGLGWTGNDLPTWDLADLDFVRNQNVLLLGTDHAGVFALHLPDPSGRDGEAAILASRQPAGLPAGSAGTELRLLPVAPIPFLGSTTIRYELPRASHARIGIHDVTGRLVLTLTDRPATAGSHSVIWDGRDASGAPLAAGIYFVRLDTGHQARTGKVVYLGGN